MQILSMFVGLVIKEVILALKEEGFDLHALHALIGPLVTMGIGRACLATHDCQDILRAASRFLDCRTCRQFLNRVIIV
jgi:hypothetical protein